MVRAQTRHEAAAREFTRRMVERRPEIQAVILYGSVARGEAHDDSDIDLVVLADRDDKTLHDDALNLALEIGDEFGVFVQEVVHSVSDFRARALEGYPWQRTIARMGQPLVDRGRFAEIRDALPPPPRIAEEKPTYGASRAIIEDHMASANTVLAEATALLNVGLWGGVSNRAYYAMFNAASAAVISCGVEEIRSHRALIDLFGKHVVHERGVEPSYRRDLETSFRLRLRADYERGFHLEETAARDALSVAKRFVARVRQFLARPSP